MGEPICQTCQSDLKVSFQSCGCLEAQQGWTRAIRKRDEVLDSGSPGEIWCDHLLITPELRWLQGSLKPTILDTDSSPLGFTFRSGDIGQGQQGQRRHWGPWGYRMSRGMLWRIGYTQLSFSGLVTGDWLMNPHGLLFLPWLQSYTAQNTLV